MVLKVLRIKTPLPRSDTQRWAKRAFFLGHPVFVLKDSAHPLDINDSRSTNNYLRAAQSHPMMGSVQSNNSDMIKQLNPELFQNFDVNEKIFFINQIESEVMPDIAVTEAKVQSGLVDWEELQTDPWYCLSMGLGLGEICSNFVLPKELSEKTRFEKVELGTRNHIT